MSSSAAALKPRNARILVLDIENAPNIGYTWDKYEQNVIEFIEEWYILCVGWKWHGAKRCQMLALPQFKGYKPGKRDDKQLLLALWPLLNEADIVVAHNGKSFDVRKINARFLKHGIKPPSPYKVVDPKIVAKAKFRLNSNKLDDIAEYLGIGRKIKTDFDLWKDVMSTDPERSARGWRKMIRYCKQDVNLLDEVYTILLPWDDFHPNITTGNGQNLCCPRCGNDDVRTLVRNGHRYLKTWRVERWLCRKCGRWSDGKRERKDPATVLT